MAFEQNPTREQIVASLAASIFVLNPSQLSELHSAIDALSNAVQGDAFVEARQRLSEKLWPARPEVKR